MDGLDVDPEAGGLGAGVAALLAHLVLDLEVDALPQASNVVTAVQKVCYRK